MKNHLLLPVIAAAVGFSIAWVVKPGNPPANPAPGIEDGANLNTKGEPSNTRTRPPTRTERSPTEVNASEFPLADLADQGPKTRSEAKMRRLAEALDLTIDQEGEIIAAIEEARAAANDQIPAIEDFTIRGKQVEENLKSILSPEQFQKLEELRTRERDNRIEARAQKTLTQVIEEIDLSPGQRQELLARLRQDAKMQIQAIPASATLLLNSSVLPTGRNDLSVDAVLVLQQLSEQPPASLDDPTETHRRLLRSQREELEQRLSNFDGILTPAQMGQYHAALAEQKAIMDGMATARRMEENRVSPMVRPANPIQPGPDDLEEDDEDFDEPEADE